MCSDRESWGRESWGTVTLISNYRTQNQSVPWVPWYVCGYDVYINIACVEPRGSITRMVYGPLVDVARSCAESKIIWKWRIPVARARDTWDGRNFCSGYREYDAVIMNISVQFTLVEMRSEIDTGELPTLNPLPYSHPLAPTEDP